MLFNSYLYIFMFLPFVLLLYFLFFQKISHNAAKAFLLVSSLGFYSWWKFTYLPIIMASIIANYCFSQQIKSIHSNKKRKTFLVSGLISNIALLCYYKYSNFFLDNLNTLTGAKVPLLDHALPLAISFFTFQQIAFLIDTYTGKARNNSFLNYALFVSFFPQLIAGPIVHHSEMMPQFRSIYNRIFKHKNASRALFIFTIGLFKKVVIADSLAVYATNGFDGAHALTFIEAWITSLSYTMQLYFDFSGYTDMAIGSALLFNIKLPINFNSPYKAQSIREFWERWHITLSRFIKDYLYIPMGGNRKKICRTYFNLMITFLLTGLWHGAGWLFIIWGGLHGLAQIIARNWDKTGIHLNKILAWSITFLFINASWVIFRATQIDDAIKVYKGMLGLNGLSLPERLSKHVPEVMIGVIKCDGFFPYTSGSIEAILWVISATLITLFLPNSNEIMNRFKPSILWVIYLVILFSISLSFISGYSEFLYFNF